MQKKNINSLVEGDYIAFGFDYNGGEPSTIIVDKISKVYDDSVLVHFLYGHHSLAEEIKKDEIIAIGNLESGESELNGWGGRFDILLEKHKLLKNK